MTLSEVDARQVVTAAGSGVSLNTVAAMIRMDLSELVEALRADDDLRRDVRQQRAMAMAVVMGEMRRGNSPVNGKEHWNRRVLGDNSYDVLEVKLPSQPPFETVLGVARDAAQKAIR